MTTTSNFPNFRLMRIFFEGDDGGGTGGAGGAGTPAPTPAPAPAASEFDAAAAAAAAVASNTQSDTPRVEWEKVVPADLRETPWMKDILASENPTERFFKDMQGLQTKLGQRVEGIPKEGSTKEEWDKFYNAIGRPETADKYELPKTAWSEEDKPIGEFIDAARGNEAFLNDVKGMLHEEGLTAKQAANLVSKYDQLYVKHNREFFKQAVDGQKQMATDYENEFKTIFGERAVTVQENGRKLLEETVPDNVKPLVRAADAKTLAIIAAALDGVHKKYVAEDSGLGGGNNPAPANEADIRAEGIKIMASEAYRDPQHPQHEATVAKVKALYATIK